MTQHESGEFLPHFFIRRRLVRTLRYLLLSSSQHHSVRDIFCYSPSLSPKLRFMTPKREAEDCEWAARRNSLLTSFISFHSGGIYVLVASPTLETLDTDSHFRGESEVGEKKNGRRRGTLITIVILNMRIIQRLGVT